MRPHRPFPACVFTVAFGLGLSATAGHAQVVVAPGETVPNVVTSADGATVNNAGTVTNRVETNNIDSGVINSGAIGTRLETNGANSGATNTGSVGTYLQTNGDNSSITNTGSVDTRLRTNGVNSGVVNSGSVGTFLRTFGDNSDILNSGTVGTFLATDGNNADIVNTGSVGTFLRTIGADARITNSGSVETLIQTTGDNSGVTNSGFVGSGAAGHGIFIAGLNPSLTLLPGSLIRGEIDLAGGGTRTLSIGNGLSAANTFTTPPTVINGNGSPFAVNGNQVAVVDLTTLAAQDETLTDLTGGIFASVQNRLGSLRNGSVVGATTNPRPLYVAGGEGASADSAREYWAQGFGSFRDQAGDGPSLGTNQYVAGFVSGVDAQASTTRRVGFFLGGSWGQVENTLETQQTDTDSFFGGVYASMLRGRIAIDAALTLGWSNYDRERQVANNLAPTGLQTATASFDGYFVSPEVTFTRPFWPLGTRFEKVVTLRYAGLFLDGFTETGAADAFTMDNRDIHLGVGRAALALPIDRQGEDGSHSRLTLTAGIEGRTQFGDETVSGTLLAQNITFDPGGDDGTIAGFASITGEHTTRGGFTAFVSLEGKLEDEHTHQVSARAGVKMRF